MFLRDPRVVITLVARYKELPLRKRMAKGGKPL